MLNELNIAVMVPCYNEELTIVKVITDIRKNLPNAIIYVYDNNSIDKTAILAKEAGCIVRKVIDKGKGNVVRRMLADIEADIYVMLDGDATYELEKAPKMILELINGRYDMVVGKRIETKHQDSYKIYRKGHRLGNLIFTKFVSWIFGKKFTDIFSGYRILSRRFVKSFQSESRNFEIETELTVHALELRLPILEIETNYYARPDGSKSKLNSFRDGFKILLYILLLTKEIKPFLFFGIIALLLALMSIILFFPVFIQYIQTGLVIRFPTAILSATIMLLAFMSLGCGIILDNVSRTQRTIKRFFYLSIPFSQKEKK